MRGYACLQRLRNELSWLMRRGKTNNVDKEKFCADWMSHMAIAELCVLHGISKDQVIRLRDVWELPKRHDRRLRARPKKTRDPTPAEIKELCKEIQETWDDKTERERRGFVGNLWDVPILDVSEDIIEAEEQSDE